MEQECGRLANGIETIPLARRACRLQTTELTALGAGHANWPQACGSSSLSAHLHWQMFSSAAANIIYLVRIRKQATF